MVGHQVCCSVDVAKKETTRGRNTVSFSNGSAFTGDKPTVLLPTFPFFSLLFFLISIRMWQNSTSVAFSIPTARVTLDFCTLECFLSNRTSKELLLLLYISYTSMKNPSANFLVIRVAVTKVCANYFLHHLINVTNS